MAYGHGAFPSARLAAQNKLNCLFVRDKPTSLPTKLGVLFQPHLLMRNNRVNLGIVPGVESLTRNLRHWTEFCLQPRLHAPVLPLTAIPDELETALEINRESLVSPSYSMHAVKNSAAACESAEKFASRGPVATHCWAGLPRRRPNATSAEARRRWGAPRNGRRLSSTAHKFRRA